jgi:hypothetical protein
LGYGGLASLVLGLVLRCICHRAGHLDSPRLARRHTANVMDRLPAEGRHTAPWCGRPKSRPSLTVTVIHTL